MDIGISISQYSFLPIIIYSACKGLALFIASRRAQRVNILYSCQIKAFECVESVAFRTVSLRTDKGYNK